MNSIDKQANTMNEILQSVSRSFALCIPLLEKNKITEVENMYLLSRVVDTIEDSSLSTERKKALMKTFFRTLRDESEIDSFLQELREGTIDEHDKILSVKENYKLILDTFHALDQKVQDISAAFLAEMSYGMMKYLDNEIKTFEDFDEYCYYVAGTIGLYMNKLVELKDGVRLDDEKAIALGRYLQKVNIIKNFNKDQQEGRNFWPLCLFNGIERKTLCSEGNEEKAISILENLVKSAAAESGAAFRYAVSVPYSLQGYRKFLILSTFMATENLRLMRRNPEIFTNPKGVKIPRSRMPQIIEMADEASCSNESLCGFAKDLSIQTNA
jgi:farnesyl-diphosphate farnesyltransferase